MVSEQKTHIKKGLIIALVLIVLDIALQLTHNKFQPWVAYLNSAILFVGVIVGINIESGGRENVVFSNLFGYGFRISVVSVCILFLYTILSVYVVFPGYLSDLYQQSIIQAQKLPNFSASNASANKEMAMKVMRISLLSMVVLFNLAVGIAGALVGTIISILRESYSNKNLQSKA